MDQIDNEPLISVIVPVYNVERYLRKCVNSIVTQTYRNLEIILVDDGSTDRSGEICDELTRTDDRIRVIHKENGGQASARNRGLDLANGEFISFIDSDDYIDPDYYMIHFTALIKHNAEITICGYTVCYEEEKKPEEYHVKEEKEITVKEFWDDVILGTEIIYGAVEPVTKLYKKTIFDDLRFREMRIIEDEEILYSIISKIESIVLVPYSGYYYLQHDKSTMHREYSLERLASGSVFIERSKKFLDDGCQKYAECTLMTAAVYISDGLKSISDDCPGKQETAKRLVEDFREAGKLIRKNSKSWKFRIKSIVFSISPVMFKTLFNP